MFNAPFGRVMPPPFGPLVSAGEEAPITLAYDTMTGDSGLSIAAHTPDIDVIGGGWQILAGIWTMRGNFVTQDDTNYNDFIAYLETSDADVSISCEVDVYINRAGVAFRVKDISNFWYACIRDNGDWTLIENDGGSKTVRGTGVGSYTSGDFYTIAVTLSGASISCTIDGGDELTYSNSLHQSETKHGLYSFRGSSSNQRYDDFTVVSV